MRILQESSINRLLKHNDRFDCAMLSAFRDAENCAQEEDRAYTRAENMQRSASLFAKLKGLGYGLMVIRGQTREGKKIKKERSFFVVNAKDHEYTDFKKRIKRFGVGFSQDFVLIIPKGAMSESARMQGKQGRPKQAFLIRTNNCKDNFLVEQGKAILHLPKLKLGRIIGDFLSFVNGRPFYFEDIEGSVGDSVLEAVFYPCASIGSLWLYNREGKRDWRELEAREAEGSPPPDDLSKIFTRW